MWVGNTSKQRALRLKIERNTEIQNIPLRSTPVGGCSGVTEYGEFSEQRPLSAFRRLLRFVRNFSSARNVDWRKLRADAIVATLSIEVFMPWIHERAINLLWISKLPTATSEDQCTSWATNVNVDEVKFIENLYPLKHFITTGI